VRRHEGDASIQAPTQTRANPSPYQAVILAAGEGSRLRSQESDLKPLTRVAGLSLLERAVRNCRDAGVSDIVLVLGYQEDKIRTQLRELAERYQVGIRSATNEDWHLGNGGSVLAAAPYIDRPFLLMMCDHLIHPRLLMKLLDADNAIRTCALAVDCQPALVRDVEEATKVLFDGFRIAAIGKSLPTYDAIDTGLFLCRELVFDALRQAAASGRHSLSDGVQLLATRGEVAWVSSDGLPWVDVDTPDDLSYARALVVGGGWPAIGAATAPVDSAPRL